jgi:hypothetical protein
MSNVQLFEPSPAEILHTPFKMPMAWTLLDYDTWEPFADEEIYQITYELQEQFISIDANGKKSFAV